jgi:Fur family transcriptional regulator, ferric uptake regulator
MATVPGEHVEPMRASAIVDRLSEAGYRLTSPRQRIVEFVAPRTDNFSAQDVVDVIHDHRLGIGRATVFRTLDLLVDMGFLHRMHSDDGCHRYAVCETQHHHHHLLCSECGAVAELEAPGIESEIQRLAAESGFELQSHVLELVGRCAQCQARSAP